MSDNIDKSVVISIRGKGGQSNEYKLLCLTPEEIIAEISKLGTINQQIFNKCLFLAEIEAKQLSHSEGSFSADDKLQIALAFFNAMSISSYTVLRSKLEKDLHER